MKIYEMYRALDALYPRSLSCAWDNDGLMVCADPQESVRRVMLSLDATDAAVQAASDAGCNVLLTHHPMIFRPLKTLTDDTLCGRRVLASIRSDVTVMSFHTRLDAGEGGVNDALAARLGFTNTEKFGDDESPALGRIAVLDAPQDAAEFAVRVCRALACPSVSLTGNHPVSRIAFVGGDGKDFLYPALNAGADTFVTGAVSYNSALDAAEEGLNVIEAGHYYTEAPVLEKLASLCRLWKVDTTFFCSNRTELIGNV